MSARQPANGRAQADPETERERQRRYYAANRDKLSERQRRYRQANRGKVNERQRRYYAANRDEINERARARARDTAQWLRTSHGLDPAGWARLWTAQKGRCYLCGDLLPGDPRRIDLDHDHRCCPRHRSCARCRRGLTHHECNAVIGFAGDDPARLRRIARNLDQARRRYEQAPEPLTLFSLNGHRAEPPTLSDLEEP